MGVEIVAGEFGEMLDILDRDSARPGLERIADFQLRGYIAR